MGDLDTSSGYQIAGGILFVMAVIGLSANLTIVLFMHSIPSLNHSFGSLTFSQAVVDSIHQALFAFYFAPCIFFRSAGMYEISEHFGLAMLTAYEICCFSHVSISVNRFIAVNAPLKYSTIFSDRNTRVLIVCYWILGIAITIAMFNLAHCSQYLPDGTWIYAFKNATDFCWYGSFVINCTWVVIVAVLDASTMLRIHCTYAKQHDAVFAQKRRSRNILVYQAALQGIFFITELITYFLLSGYAQDKWVAFALTTVSWCLVNGMDGVIVLVFNRELRQRLLKLLRCRSPIVQAIHGTTRRPSMISSSSHNH